MMRRGGVLLAAALMLGSCVATREDVAGVEVQMARLEKNLANLEKRQTDLAAQLDALKRPLESLNSNLNDTQNLLNNFNPKFEEIRSQMEGLRREILARQGEVMKSLAQEQKDLEGKFSALEESLSQKIVSAQAAAAKTPAKGGTNVKSNGADKDKKEASSFSSAGASDSTAADAPLKLFQDAYKDFLAQRWDLAENGFDSYLKANPAGSLADKSLYYKAQAQKEKKNFSAAHATLDQLSNKFPKSPVARAGILEKSKLFLTQNKTGEAEGMLEYLIVSYAGSKEAEEARELLKEIPHPKK